MTQTQPGQPTAPAGVLDRLHERLRGLDESADRAVLARVHSRGLMFLGYLETVKDQVSDGNNEELKALIKFLEVE